MLFAKLIIGIDTLISIESDIDIVLYRNRGGYHAIFQSGVICINPSYLPVTVVTMFILFYTTAPVQNATVTQLRNSGLSVLLTQWV